MSPRTRTRAHERRRFQAHRRRGRVLVAEALEDRRLLTTIPWDDLDSHRWTAESWGDPTTDGWVEFGGRHALRVDVQAAGAGWGLIRTDSFPVEDWTDYVGLRADVYQVGEVTAASVKLEVRGAGFEPVIEAIGSQKLAGDAWTTITWPFQSGLGGLAAVSHLSLVFDHLSPGARTYHVDNLRLVDATGQEIVWDDMDDGSRDWFYFGDWHDWNPSRRFGLEPVSRNGGGPASPGGAVFLQWDGPAGAEVGTAALDDRRDWTGIARLEADVRISDPSRPVSVFLYNAETASGFGSPSRVASRADEWEHLVWDLPWPATFDASRVSELKFVVNGLSDSGPGTLFLDNISLRTPESLTPLPGVNYDFAGFERATEPGGDKGLTDFGTDWNELVTEYVTATVVAPVATSGPTFGAEQTPGALEVSYDLPPEQFTGLWFSLWGLAGCKATGGPNDQCAQAQSIDFTDIYGQLAGPATDFDQIQFWVRGSGATNHSHQIKIEIKDVTDSYSRTAYRYITIDDSDTTWREVVLDADVTNTDFWTYNQDAPDPTQLKFLVFTLESFFNDPSGTFYLDNIRFTDVDATPAAIAELTDDEFLDRVGERTFLYFLDWYDRGTGLFFDRSSFSNLMSVAATGFGLTALVVAEQRGWLDRTEAINRARQTLTTLRDGQSAGDTLAMATSETNGYRGFFYHFLNTRGTRKFNDVDGEGSELSPIDTALLIMGALTVREHFSDEADLVALVDEITNRVDWNWMLGATQLMAPDVPAEELDRFFLGWKPELDDQGEGRFEIAAAEGGGYFSSRLRGAPSDRLAPAQWDYSTDEAMLISILAMAFDNRVPTEVFYAWKRERGADGNAGFITSYNGSLFTYFFAHLWIDFRTLGEDAHPDPALRVDWWTNALAAVASSRQFAIDHADTESCTANDRYTTYGPDSWGLTAADGPDGMYHAYGAPPAQSPNQDGTIATYGAGSAMMFTPAEAIAALRHYYDNTDLWNERLGFGDAYSLDTPDCGGPWYDRAVFGIDDGPMLIAIENARSGLIWQTIGRNEPIQGALARIFDPGRPPLTILLDSQIMESGSSLVTVRRDASSPWDFELPIAIQVSDPGELDVPEEVVIPAGAGEFTFTVRGVADGAIDGAQSVEVRAVAAGFHPALASTLVVDLGHPYPWHNGALPEDVDGNGVVLINDIVPVLQDVILHGTRTLAPPDPARTVPPYLDVSRDNSVGLTDMVLVLQYVIVHSGGEGEFGDSESARPQYAPAAVSAAMPRIDAHAATDSMLTGASTLWTASQDSDLYGLVAVPPAADRCGVASTLDLVSTSGARNDLALLSWLDDPGIATVADSIRARLKTKA